MTKELLKQAQQKHRQGELTEALALYQQFLADNPKNADVLHQIGIVYAQLENYAEAVHYIDAALEQEQNAAYFNSKGNLLLRVQDYESALNAYRKAIKLNSRYEIAHNNLGRCLYFQEKLVAAQKAYERALEINPNFGDAYYNLGILLTKLGKLPEALFNLQKALTFSSRQAPIYGQIAQIYLQQADYPAAIEFLQKRLNNQPTHVDSLHYLGMAFLVQNELDFAIDSFEKILLITHKHPQCYEHLATAYYKLDDKEKALTYFLRQLEILPTANAYFNIGVLLSDQGRRREAIDYFKQAIQYDPMHLAAYLNLGVEYLKSENLTEAEHYYEQAARINPDDAEIQHILMALTQKKIPEKAPAEYLKNLFNQYASYYDKHLTESLRYRVPQLLHQSIYSHTKIEEAKWVTLDLGCGTGLCGELFKEFSHRLIGIDISPEMVNIAKEKNIYDELVVADIDQALDQYKDLDLVLAADVFAYMGELDSIFAKVSQRLNPGGLFAFSVEQTEKIPYELQPSIRYAHSREYLENLIAKHGFETIQFQTTHLRMQKEKPVEGFIILVKKQQ